MSAQLIKVCKTTSSSTKPKKGNTPENLISTVPPTLKDLVGARAGQAENELISRGYTYKNTVTFDGGKSAYYVENKGFQNHNLYFLLNKMAAMPISSRSVKHVK